VKWNKLSVIVLGLVLSSSAFAANTQQELYNLQAQISQLNKQLASIPTNIATASTSHVMTDSLIPLGAMSKVHFPYALLKAKNKLNAPLVMGGQLEADAQNWNGSYTFNTDSPNQRGRALGFTKLYLFSVANLNPWATTVVTIKNSLPNNTVTLDRAYVSFGNLAQNPWYLTVGNAFLPFGSFSGNGPLDNSLPTNSFRVNPTNQVMLGHNANGFDTDVGFYSGNFTNNAMHNYLANVSWTGALNTNSTLNVAAGYINEVRGTSSGVGTAYINTCGSSTYGVCSANTLTGSQTGAYDLNATYTLNQLSFLGELVATTANATINSQVVGKPSVWMLGTVYKHQILNKPTQFQLSYSQTRNMQTIQLPTAANYMQNLKITGIKSEWLASITPEVFNNLYIGPEFDYNHLYTGNNTWTLTVDATGYF